ncbi:hypothetical protein [Actinomadura rupiterrae]|uniref:hypothetical protein n=1 Tax=Actinomadura rupiterrae TaxID=559627 RepID=UPI0020A5D9A0|nr:hypothetical protein [Actinomadura rupiterrae]MCP2342875.1 hypothetical protein [Actinomadura rupiterrae]
MIRTVLKTATVAATIAGATFLAAPANASTHNHNHGTANGNNVNFMIVGGYGVTCGSVSLSSQSGTSCNGNGVHNLANHSDAEGFGGAFDR